MLSKAYRKQLERIHSDPTIKWGNDGKYHREVVERLSAEVSAKTMLDFGAGRSSLSKALKRYGSRLHITDYEPGRPKKAVLPRGPFDMVTCTDVLEHVEPEQVDTVLQAIAARTRKRAFFVIDCVEANAVLPDGRNAHLTVAPPMWWAQRLGMAFGSAFEADFNEQSFGKKLIAVVTRK